MNTQYLYTGGAYYTPVMFVGFSRKGYVFAHSNGTLELLPQEVNSFIDTFSENVNRAFKSSKSIERPEKEAKTAKVSYSKESGTFSLTGLSAMGLSAMATVLKEVNGRCFNEREANGVWYSGGDFMCSLNDSEREALHEVCRALIG